ncbi:MAG: hypothetical protein WBW88_17235 [Rhodothermales bacterium]
MIRSFAVTLGLLAFFLSGLGRNVVFAQFAGYDAMPSVTVSTDKASYQQFEAVVATVNVTNTSSRFQDWGPPVWRQATALHFEITSPDSQFVPRHPILAVEGTHIGPTPKVTYAPGQTRSASFNLLPGVDLWSKLGTYKLSVSIDKGGPAGRVELDNTVFSVDSLSSQWTTIADTLATAATYTFTGRAWTWGAPDVNSMLAVALDKPNLPLHVVEFAKWVRAIYTELDFGVDDERRAALDFGPRPTEAKIDSLYSAFLQEFPSSPFAIAATQRLAGLRDYVGAELYELDPSPFAVRARLFLEGAYYNGSMLSNLSPPEGNALPLDGPYEDEPWNSSYPASTPMLSETFVDWVYGQIVDTSATPDSLVSETTGMLLESGYVGFEFPRFRSGHYALVVDHRNHVAVISDTLVDMTNGYAEHDFTTGHALAGVPNPQKQIVSGQDTVYAMWAGDANGDGLVAAADFDAWLQSTTAGETGYRAADFNMDRQVTALDFTKWIANTTAHAETGISDSLYNILYPPDGGGAGLTIQSELTGPQCYVRLNVTRNTGNDYWVDIEARTDVADQTLASMTVDVFYDSSEVALLSTDPGVLQDGYSTAISERVREAGHFVRVEFRASGIPNQSLGHDLDTSWEVIRSLKFSRTPPKHDAGTSIRARTIAIDFFTVHWNAGGYNGTVSSPVEIQ